MKRNGGSGFAILLIGCGAIILLGSLGFGLGHLMGYIIPLAMVLLGWVGVQRGSKFFGWLLMVVGAIILLGKFSGLIGLIVAVGMIGYGVSMLRKRRTPY